jgi:proteic killer suppression protein
MPVQSFRRKGLKRLFEQGDPKGVPAQFAGKIGDMLAAIDAAEVVEDVGLFPGWRLHALKGDLTGFWSLAVSGNWRLIFHFENGDAHELDFVDYH